MALTLDHLVILVPDLGTAIAACTAQGFTVQPGGTHADGGTHNALVVFEDGSYLELIAFLRPHPGHRWGGHAARGHQGFVDFALLPPSVSEVVAAAAARGLAYQGPLPGGRLRPDGERLAWQMGLPPTPDLPFLCGDLTPRHLRVPEGAVRQHANGATGVATLTVAVPDLAASLQRYAALLGLDSLPPVSAFGGAGLHPAAAGPGLQQACLPLGRGTLVLVAAAPGEPAPPALTAALGGRPAGVIGLALRAPRAAVLPTAGTCGAPITLVTNEG